MSDVDDDAEDFDTDMDGDAEGAEDQDGAADDGQEDTDDPAELKKRLARAAAALKKANAQAARLRKATKAPAKKAVLAAAEQAPTKDESADERYRRQAIRTEGAAAILEAGFAGDRKAARELTKLLDTEILDVDEDGEVDGLDDAVDELKDKYPQLFQSQQQDQSAGSRRRHRVPPIDSAAGRSASGSRRGAQPQSTAEKLALALRGGR